MRNVIFQISTTMVIVLTSISCGNQQTSDKGSAAPVQKHQSGAPQEELSSTQMDTLMNRGHRIVNQSFNVLSKQLMDAVRDGGPPHAVSYCEISADDILTSARTGREEITRTSLKYRNPDNAPNESEMSILKGMHKEIKVRGEASPQLIVENGMPHYYEPIYVRAFCLNCHGEIKKDISGETLSVIDSLYPEDRARGYRDGDLRGMWHIAFNEKLQ